jgi:hypothetical protein
MTYPWAHRAGCGMGDGELPHLLSETDSGNFLAVPVAILLGAASFWNELGAVLHYGSKRAKT